jgi:hypothetical protein
MSDSAHRITALDYAAGCAKRHWNYSNSRGLLARLFRRVGTIRSLDGIWICRHALGDWSNARCTGEPVETWCYDDSGLRTVDGLPAIDLTGAIVSRTPVLSFCLDDRAQRMIYVEWYGVRVGSGQILRAKQNGKWVTEQLVWIS